MIEKHDWKISTQSMPIDEANKIHGLLARHSKGCNKKTATTLKSVAVRKWLNSGKLSRLKGDNRLA